MNDREIVEDAAAALAAVFGGNEGAAGGSDGIHQSMSSAATALALDIPEDDVHSIVESILARPAGRRVPSITRESIARWFEVSVDQFERTPKNRLDPAVLVRHLYYERLLETWFQSWNYEVELGRTFDGIGGTEFTPDVHASLETLHGSFQSAAVIFCTDPVDTFRVGYYLQGIEAFARKNPTFGKRDIYMMVTPFDFGEDATAHIRNEEEEDYFVVALEGHDLRSLDSAIDPDERKERLQDLVKDARREDAEPF